MLLLVKPATIITAPVTIAPLLEVMTPDVVSAATVVVPVTYVKSVGSRDGSTRHHCCGRSDASCGGWRMRVNKRGVFRRRINNK